MGVEGVHIVETRMFCTVCLKSSCLLICVHSWSLDLSQTLIITNDPNSERGKNWSKTMGKKITPCHLSSFSSDSQTLSTGRNLLFCLLFFGVLDVFATLAQKCLKTHGKTQKTKSFTPCHPSTFSSDLLHGSKLYVFFTEYVQIRMELKLFSKYMK